MAHTTQQLLNLARNFTRTAFAEPDYLETGDAVNALHAFKALDRALSRGAPIPSDWSRARRNPAPTRRPARR